MTPIGEIIAQDVRAAVRGRRQPGFALAAVSILALAIGASGRNRGRHARRSPLRPGMAQPRFASLVLSALAVLGVTLASAGLFAVLSYAVAQRRHELSIRAARGADRGRLLGMVLREGLAVTLVGLGVGLAGAAGLSRLLAGLLFQVTPLDTLSFAAAPLLLLPAAAIASLAPASRAASAHPAEVLRDGG